MLLVSRCSFRVDVYLPVSICRKESVYSRFRGMFWCAVIKIIIESCDVTSIVLFKATFGDHRDVYRYILSFGNDDEWESIGQDRGAKSLPILWWSACRQFCRFTRRVKSLLAGGGGRNSYIREERGSKQTRERSRSNSRRDRSRERCKIIMMCKILLFSLDVRPCLVKQLR